MPIPDFDELWPGGPRFRCGKGVFPLSTDSVLLAAFVRKLRYRRALDLGCGAGVLMVLLSAFRPAAKVEGIEIQPQAASLCRENLLENGLDPSGLVCGDLRRHRDYFAAGAYDLVVCNPPYFAGGSGYSSPDPSRAKARDERLCTLADCCQSAKSLCRWGGAFALVHRPERLSEALCLMSASGLEPKRLRMVQYAAGSPPNLILAEGRRGGKPGLKIEPPLLLTEPGGGDSPEIREIYHRE